MRLIVCTALLCLAVLLIVRVVGVPLFAVSGIFAAVAVILYELSNVIEEKS